MKATMKFALLALALNLLPASAHAVGYSITIPPVAGYPETTIKFSEKALITNTQSVPASSMKVTFKDARWSAQAVGGRWSTTGAGTYFLLACDPSSVVCMNATKGHRAYTYTLIAPTPVAPKSKGSFHLTWDVNPPGDAVSDAAILPEPSGLILLATGLASLVGLTRRKMLTR